MTVNNLGAMQMLIRYTAWANELIFAAVSRLDPAECTKERNTVFKSILNTLNHNYVIALIWQANLMERNHGITEHTTKEVIALDSLWNLQRKIDEWYMQYTDTSHEVFNVPVQFKSISGTVGCMTREEILLHVVNHTTYHRGFIADMFWQIPAQPPTTDLPVYLQTLHNENTMTAQL